MTLTGNQKMAAASANSWKDEFWTIVLAVPLFCLGYSVVVDDPAILERVSNSFLLWILFQIGISIYCFWQYLRHLESVVLTSS